MQRFSKLLSVLERYTAKVAVSLAVVACGYTTSAFAQQGSQSSLSLPVFVPNGPSYSPNLLGDGSSVVYISDATNLPNGQAGRIYIQKIGGSDPKLFDAPYPALELRAAAGAYAGLFRLPRGGIVIGYRLRNGSGWNWRGVRGDRAGIDVLPDGRVCYAYSTNDRTYVYLVGPEGQSELILPEGSTAPPVISSSSEAIVVTLVRTVGGYVISVIGVDALNYDRIESSGPGVIDRSGDLLVTPSGIFRIDYERGGTQPRVTPVEDFPSPISPVDFDGTRLVYTDERGYLRILDLQARTDIPIARVSSTVKPSRILQGNRVVFSTPQPLDWRDANRVSDVYLYDTSTLQVTGITVGSVPVSGHSEGAVIGYSNQSIAFTSNARLVPGKTTPYYDAFFSFRGTFQRIMGGQQPDGDSFLVSVLRTVDEPTCAFASRATNLPGAVGGVTHVYYWRRGSLTCVSADLSDGENYNPVVAPNNTVYFLSTSSRLIRDPDRTPQAYRWQNGALSRPIGFSQGYYFESVEAIAVSPSGRYIALTARLDPNDSYSIFIFDSNLRLVQVLRTSHDMIATDISDRSTVVFQTEAQLVSEDRDNLTDVYVWKSGQYQLVSRNPVGSKANAPSFGGKIDLRGQRVTFFSEASNLVPMDLNQEADVFVYDLQNGWLYCASRNSLGLLVGGSRPSISGDGRYLVYMTGSPEPGSIPLANGVYIVLHEIGCTPPGDVNLDGQVDDTDLLSVLLNFGTRGATNADLNVDGTVDDADLLVVLVNFGTGCAFGLAGGNPDEQESEPPYLVRLASGRALIYYPTTPKRFYRLVGEEAQRQEIDQALLYGRSAYPMTGGIFNPWREMFGSPVGWTQEEVEQFRQFIDGEPGGDFAPAWGNPFDWSWSNIYSYQPRPDTYVRFRPELKFSANACRQYIHGALNAALDLRVLGIGRDNLAEFKAGAGMTPGWTGFKVEAYFNGDKKWEDGWYTQGNWSWNRTYDLARFRVYQGSFNFIVAGVPCTASIAIDGYANASLGFNLQLSPSTASANFTPSAGMNLTFLGGVGGTILGTTVTVGLNINLRPLVQLSLPATASLRTAQRRGGGCDLVASANVRLTLQALRGNLRVGIFTSCLGWPFCKKCNAGAYKPILGYIPARCCDEPCGGKKKRRIDASVRIASWNGLNYNLATILDQEWRWPIK